MRIHFAIIINRLQKQSLTFAGNYVYVVEILYLNQLILFDSSQRFSIALNSQCVEKKNKYINPKLSRYLIFIPLFPSNKTAVYIVDTPIVTKVLQNIEFKIKCHHYDCIFIGPPDIYMINVNYSLQKIFTFFCDH